jgi:dihydrofolate reductase
MPARPRIALIYARASNGVIGREGTMPWHLPEDLARFRALTQGHPVIMGRKTWDSLPDRFRPLPGRRNIVLTRQSDWQASGAERADSLEQALLMCAQQEQVWVIGGAQIYAQALPLAHRVEVTEIHQEIAGDAFAPELGAQWRPTSHQSALSTSGLNYSFVSYERV